MIAEGECIGGIRLVAAIGRPTLALGARSSRRSARAWCPSRDYRPLAFWTPLYRSAWLGARSFNWLFRLLREWATRPYWNGPWLPRGLRGRSSVRRMPYWRIRSFRTARRWVRPSTQAAVLKLTSDDRARLWRSLFPAKNGQASLRVTAGQRRTGLLRSARA